MDEFPFTSRNTKTDVPLNWTPIKMRGKAEWRCNQYKFVFLYNEVRRCSHCCRKQYIKNHKNRHVYGIAQKDDQEFDKNMLIKFQNISYTSFNQRYVKYLGTFCGKVDLSCQKASSDALRTFSINCIQLGADISTQLGKNINVNQILNPISDKTVKEAILTAAENDFEEKVQNFQKYKYTALLCDAGTVLKLHCLHFYIARFNEPIDKLLFETFDVKNADSMFYLNCFYEVFQKCDKYNIFVCSVTCDQLPAQTSGFQTFQITSDNPLIESVLKIPCFGHLCNNVFLDLVKKNSTFNELIHIILDKVIIILSFIQRLLNNQ